MFKKNKLLLFISAALTLTLTIQFFPRAFFAAPSDAVNKVKNDIVLRIGSSKALVCGKFEFIDGDNLNVIPFVRNNIPYVPLRFIAESLGGTVTVKTSSSFTVELNGNKIDITAGDGHILINGEKTMMEAKSLIENGRTFLPVSSLAEVINKNIFFEDDLVIVSDNETPLTLPADNELLDKLKAELSVIPSFGTRAEFDEYIAEAQKIYNPRHRDYIIEEEALNSVPMPTAAASPQLESVTNKSADFDSDYSSDYSEVNIQVQGVDEADIIRTDGKYIYTLTSNFLSIINAYPSSQMQIVSRYAFSNSMPLEMYADQDKLTVVSSSGKRRETAKTAVYKETVNITVFDVSNKEKPSIVKETEIEGQYLSSRKIGENVYVVTNMSAYYNEPNPCYYESDVEKQIPAPNIYVFPGSIRYDYLTIAGISLDRLNDEPDINVYMGAGTTIYVSQKYMYIAEPSYNYNYNDIVSVLPWLTPSLPQRGSSTIIHKLSLYDGRSSYIGSGAVPGTILNQFSMDEHNSYFRIATNANNGNNVYILDSQLKLKNSIEDIAPGEMIYSTRFMGNRGYMVTFKTTDPLFVIDLDPENPKILGALKIPGYSDYLHPYDENTIIGFGKDTVESKNVAYYQGMKMAIFDVSDVSDPQQKFVEIIGSRGTESDLLYDHKALLFDKSKNLLAFPVTVYEGGGDDASSYGAFKFQGAYVYDISLDKGFQKRGEITHLTDEEYKKAGNWYYNDEAAVKRIIYIGDSLYTLSNRTLMAHDMESVKYQNKVYLTK